MSACAGQSSAEKDPGDGTVKPIPPTVISDCVKKWTAMHKQTIPAWAYDGRNNLYAPKTLVEKGKLTADSYQEFPMEFQEAGKCHPSRYLCAFASVALVTVHLLVLFDDFVLSSFGQTSCADVCLEEIKLTADNYQECRSSVFYRLACAT